MYGRQTFSMAQRVEVMASTPLRHKPSTKLGDGGCEQRRARERDPLRLGRAHQSIGHPHATNPPVFSFTPGRREGE